MCLKPSTPCSGTTATPLLVGCTCQMFRAEKLVGATFWPVAGFRRAWTLQELIAPGQLLFYASDWTVIGRLVKGKPEGMKDDEVWRRHSPSTPKTFVEEIASVTKIALAVLQQGVYLKKQWSCYCAAEILSWVAERKSTRPEDMAYSMLGLLRVNMPLLYGEGEERAFVRLQQHFIANDISIDGLDDSIFCWSHDYALDPAQRLLCSFSGMLATRATMFRSCSGITRIRPGQLNYVEREQSTSVTNEVIFSGPYIRVPNIIGAAGRSSGSLHVFPLNCLFRKDDGPSRQCYVVLSPRSRIGSRAIRLHLPGPVLRLAAPKLETARTVTIYRAGIVLFADMPFLSQDVEPMSRWIDIECRAACEGRGNDTAPAIVR